MLSPVGKALRQLRLEREERLMDMACHLGVTSSFLSAIEMGRKAPPREFAEKVQRAYGLKGGNAEAIRAAAAASQKTFKIEAKSALARDTAGLLADRFSKLTDSELVAIKDLLKKK